MRQRGFPGQTTLYEPSNTSLLYVLLVALMVGAAVRRLAPAMTIALICALFIMICASLAGLAIVSAEGNLRIFHRRYSRVGASGTVASIDGRLGQAVLMRRSRPRPPAPRSSFAGFRFPPEVITIAERWYLRYGLSYRDVEELLAERASRSIM
jgi:hypothetical protein